MSAPNNPPLSSSPTPVIPSTSASPSPSPIPSLSESSSLLLSSSSDLSSLTLDDLRIRIDSIDRSLIDLLNQRMNISLHVGRCKNNAPGGEGGGNKSLTDKDGKSLVYVPSREKLIFEKVVKYNDSIIGGTLSNLALIAVYREIMSASINLQRSTRIAYIGPPASFTHQAALSRFGASLDYIFCPSVESLCHAIETGQADYGVVPLEHSIYGSHQPTLHQLMYRNNLHIYAEIVGPMQYTLLAGSWWTERKLNNNNNNNNNQLSTKKEEGTEVVEEETEEIIKKHQIERQKAKADSFLYGLSQIKKIYSHPAAFAVCSSFLHYYLPFVELVSVSNTSEAAEKSSTERYSACLAPKLAAQVYSLNLVQENLQPAIFNRENELLKIINTGANQMGASATSKQFLSSYPGKKSNEKFDGMEQDINSGAGGQSWAPDSVSDTAIQQQWARWIVLAVHPERTTGRDKSFIMFTVKDSHGALYDALAAFKLYNINLTKIESRPSSIPGDHDFFVEMLGHQEDLAIKRAVESLRTACKRVRVIGSCPVPLSMPLESPPDIRSHRPKADSHVF